MVERQFSAAVAVLIIHFYFFLVPMSLKKADIFHIMINQKLFQLCERGKGIYKAKCCFEFLTTMQGGGTYCSIQGKMFHKISLQ
jgi:hypothetical protein